VEQSLRFAASVADRHYVIERGHVIDMVLNRDLNPNLGRIRAYLGV
jgi:branched-chain amino acid transport system ATP-binding protein